MHMETYGCANGRYNLSSHAIIRMKERSIPTDVVELLLVYGDTRPAPGGATRYYFSKDALSELAEVLKDQFSAVERYAVVYLVVAPDNCVVTVAYARHERRRREIPNSRTTHGRRTKREGARSTHRLRVEDFIRNRN